MVSSIDLARMCGVSKGTVDRALHNRPGISEKTRKRILKAAKEHGYRPHPEIASLVGGASPTVGAVLPALRSIFFLDAMNAIQEKLSDHGLRLHICPTRSEDEFLDALEDYAARKIRAAVVIPPRENMVLPAYLELPVVSLRVPIKGPNVRFVGMNHVETGRDAVKFLYRKGHRTIAHATFPERAADGWTRPYSGRQDGYLAEMKARRLKPNVIVADDNANRVLSEIKKSKATAIFCHNDWLAVRVIRYLNQAGLAVPDDISILGVDDTPTFTEVYPGLTSLHYPLGKLADTVAGWIASKKRPGKLPAMKVVARDTVRER